MGFIRYTPIVQAENGESGGLLEISNSDAKLTVRNLLIGNTPKTKNNAAGPYCEGLKIASLVLCSAGLPVICMTNGQIWRFNFQSDDVSKPFRCSVKDFAHINKNLTMQNPRSDPNRDVTI